MKQDTTQAIPEWINSNHPQYHKEPVLFNGLSGANWERVMALQEEADNLRTALIFLCGLGFAVGLVIYLMWKHGLIIH